MKSRKIPMKSPEFTIFHGFSTPSPGIPRWHRAGEEQDAGHGLGRQQLQELVVQAQDVQEGPVPGQADP